MGGKRFLRAGFAATRKAARQVSTDLMRFAHGRMDRGRPNPETDWRRRGPVTDIEAQEALKAMFQAAVDAASPGLCLPPHLPAPPKGRTIVVGAAESQARKGLGGIAHGRGSLIRIIHRIFKNRMTDVHKHKVAVGYYHYALRLQIGSIPALFIHH